jgi:hypothetical protein
MLVLLSGRPQRMVPPTAYIILLVYLEYPIKT